MLIHKGNLIGEGDESLAYQAKLDSNGLSTPVIFLSPRTHRRKQSITAHLNAQALAQEDSALEKVVQITNPHLARPLIYLEGVQGTGYAIPDIGVVSLAESDFFPTSLKDLDALVSSLHDGLASLHNNGIVHRDIKHSNILVGKQGFAQLADFGNAGFLEGKDRPYFVRNSTSHTRPSTLNQWVAGQSSRSSIQDDLYALAIATLPNPLPYKIIEGELSLQQSRNQKYFVLIRDKIFDRITPDKHKELVSEAVRHLPFELRSYYRKALAFDPENSFSSSSESLYGWTQAQNKHINRRKHSNYGLSLVAAGVMAIALWGVNSYEDRQVTQHSLTHEQRLGLLSPPPQGIDAPVVDSLAYTTFMEQAAERGVSGRLTFAIAATLEDSVPFHVRKDYADFRWGNYSAVVLGEEFTQTGNAIASVHHLSTLLMQGHRGEELLGKFYCGENASCDSRAERAKTIFRLFDGDGSYSPLD